MNELIAAAKAVIDTWEHGRSPGVRIQQLRAAVERAEKQEPVGFGEWFENQPKYPTFEQTWTAAQQAERERCREIVITMGGPDVPDLLRQIDSGEV